MLVDRARADRRHGASAPATTRTVRWPTGPAVRRRLGYLPQEVTFPRGFTAFEFVDYVAVLKEWGDTAAPPRRGPPGARAGRPGRRRVTQRIKALSGGHAPPPGARPGPARRPRAADPRRTHRRAWTRSSGSRVPGPRLRAWPERPVVLVSTHQTEDVAALCDAGRRASTEGGSASTARSELARRRPRGPGVARPTERDPRAHVVLAAPATGSYRQVGDPPAGAPTLVEPTARGRLPAHARRRTPGQEVAA